MISKCLVALGLSFEVMKPLSSLASAAAFLLSAAVFAQTSAPAPSRAVLSDLSWMAGRWVDDSGGNLSEEIWSAPSGDSMMGMWRYVSGGQVRIFELLTVSVEPTGIVMRLRHFDPELTAREDKGTPVELALVGWKPREAAFEGPAVGAATGKSVSPIGGRRRTR